MKGEWVSKRKRQYQAGNGQKNIAGNDCKGQKKSGEWNDCERRKEIKGDRLGVSAIV